MKSYLTGYPATMVPLGIAYPDDPQATEPPNFQWMIGDSLLCAPLLKNHSSGKMDLYLPEGIWFDYDTGEKPHRPQAAQGLPHAGDQDALLRWRQGYPRDPRLG